MLLRHLRLWAILLIAGISSAAAQDASPPNSGIEQTFDAAIKAATHGPADVALRDLATIHLPDPYSFIPVTQGAAFMRALGNTTGDNFHGLVIPKQHDKFWFVEITYTDSGYIKDDDAKSWKADDLLQSIKDATEASNKDRAERGYPPLDIVGWVEKPAYDASTHRLVWSILAKQRGNEAQGATINYNTYALGRQGYFELNLVTGETYIAEDKKHAGAILAALDYKPGERYTDFNASTDRVAEYGLAALIGGFAAKKLGLLAVIGVTLAKFWKIILIAIAVAGGGIFKLFRRKNTTPQA
ncbi:DUF2167 domain-containing protein [Taklimakanibacter deserti]|uniref:DUF2167 domain-containing protein n=1 Tax=Taklimakanibacter deserti TaxID=2267839 RepID=UPI000E647C81